VILIAEQYQALKQKLQGHYAYYGGLIGNTRCLYNFRYEVTRLWGTFPEMVLASDTLDTSLKRKRRTVLRLRFRLVSELSAPSQRRPCT
jgi:hypothetical protein